MHGSAQWPSPWPRVRLTKERPRDEFGFWHMGLEYAVAITRLDFIALDRLRQRKGTHKFTSEPKISTALRVVKVPTPVDKTGFESQIL